jgi:AAA15 family ATPase/GTPase
MTNDEVDGFLRDLLISFGDIDAITLSHYTKSDDKDLELRSRFAHVCFKKKKSLQAVLTASNGMFTEISTSISQKWGMAPLMRPKKYNSILEANRIEDTDVNELKRKVDSVLEEYEMTEKVFLPSLLTDLWNRPL